jgi:hypothetical protein
VIEVNMLRKATLAIIQQNRENGNVDQIQRIEEGGKEDVVITKNPCAKKTKNAVHPHDS